MAPLSKSTRDYLMAILELSEASSHVRSVDLAEKMGVTRASVNRVVTILKEVGYIYQERYSDIFLTEKGRKEAVSIAKRYGIIKRFLIEVMEISEETAEMDARFMEHGISKETLNKMKKMCQQK